MCLNGILYYVCNYDNLTLKKKLVFKTSIKILTCACVRVISHKIHIFHSKKLRSQLKQGGNTNPVQGIFAQQLHKHFFSDIRKSFPLLVIADLREKYLTSNHRLFIQQSGLISFWIWLKIADLVLTLFTLNSSTNTC